MDQLKKVRQLRIDAYKEYLAFKYKMSADRTILISEKELLVKNAFEKYKEIEAHVDAIEDMIELEILERDTINSLKCPY
ncbi:MAG: hypothetical protein RR942_15015 [Romboutsia sp.]